MQSPKNYQNPDPATASEVFAGEGARKIKSAETEVNKMKNSSMA